MAETEKLQARTFGPVSHFHTRLDLARDTAITVQRNIRGHVYVTIGNHQTTLIIHPHAAVRLVANINAVLAGADFTYD